MSETDVTITEEIKQAVKELREEVGKVSDQQDPAKIEAINTKLDGFEEVQQKLLKEQGERANKELDYQERIETLECEVAKKSAEPGRKNAYKDSEEYKTINTFMRFGEHGLTIEEVKTLRTDNDPAGGFLVPELFDDVLTKKITEISAIRSIARVRTIDGKSIEMPIRNSIPTATYEGEASEGTDSESDYQSVTFTPHRQTFTTPITADLLQDANFDMESELLQDASEAFAQGEGKSFVNGIGPNVPQGFVSNPTIQADARPSATAAELNAIDLLLLTGDLKTGYNPQYVMNRRVLAEIRIQKDDVGGFLWAPGLNGAVVNTIAGFPYLIANDMEDADAAGKFPIAFGDFMRGYVIVDRMGLRVIRDEVTSKRQAIIEFTFNRWNTGSVILTEAIKLLVIS